MGLLKAIIGILTSLSGLVSYFMDRAKYNQGRTDAINEINITEDKSYKKEAEAIINADADSGVNAMDKFLQSKGDRK